MYPLRLHMPYTDITSKDVSVKILIVKMYPLRVHMPYNDIDS